MVSEFLLISEVPAANFFECVKNKAKSFRTEKTFYLHSKL